MLRHVRSLTVISTLFFGSLLWAAATSPDQTIHKASNEVLQTLRTNKKTLSSQPEKLYSYIEQSIVPLVDMNTVAKWVLGREARKATPDQINRFTNEFKELLIRSYASTLLEYSDGNITVTPLTTKLNTDDEITVRSTISVKGQSPIPVNYVMHYIGGQWKIIDLQVENVSIVTNYRKSIAEEVQKRGMDGTIQLIADKNKKGQK